MNGINQQKEQIEQTVRTEQTRADGHHHRGYESLEVQGHLRWVPVILGSLIMMCLGTVYSWSVFRLSVQEVYGVGATAGGLPYMASLAFYAVSMLLTGRHLGDVSPRKMIWIGSVLVAGGWMLSSLVTGIVGLTLSYGVLIGTGVGFAYGAPMIVAARWFPRQKGLAVGLVLLGFGMSPLVTAPLVRILLEGVGLSRTFLILGAAFGVLMPLLAIPLRLPPLEGAVVGSGRGRNGDPHEVSTDRMLRTRSFPGLYGTFLIGTTIGLTVIGLTGPIGITHVGLSSAGAAGLISLFAVFNGLGRPLFGWLTDRLGPQNAIRISYGLITAASALMLLAGPGRPVAFALAFSLFWLNLGGWLAIAPTTTLSFYGTRYYGQNYGVLFTAYGLGAVVGVLLSGFILDVLGSVSLIFALVAVLAMTGLLLSGRVVREQTD